MFLDNFGIKDMSKITMQDEKFVKRVMYKTFQIIAPRSLGRKIRILPSYYKALNDYVTQNIGRVITLRDMSKFLRNKFV